MKISLNRISSLMYEASIKSNTSISLQNTKIVHELSQRLSKSFEKIEIVPTYNTVGIHFANGNILHDELHSFIDSFVPNDSYQIHGKQYSIPTMYSVTEDVHHMCRIIGISEEELFTRHSEREYLVAMVGFKPNFPYLLGLDEKISFPRKLTPSRRIDAGSVAIGGAQTGVYSQASPGGWWVIGKCDPQLLHQLKMGDTVKFERIVK